MEIFVCVKRVVATDSKVKPAADGKNPDPQGLQYVVNPYDEFAVEEALKTKEARGGTVTVVCLGPADAQKEVRTCLAVGCDQAIHLEDKTHNRDAYSTAEILANVLRDKKPDLILFGKQAVDGDQSQVGQRVATLLGLPCVHEVSKLEIVGTRVTAERDIEGGREVVECELPAVITAQKGLNEPRYANLKGIMAAKKKPLEQVAFADVPVGAVVEAMTTPPARNEGRILGEGAAAVPALIEALRNEVKIF